MTKYIEKTKKRIFEIIQIGNRTDVASLFFDIFIVGIILLNIFITFFQTYAQYEDYKSVFDKIEFITIIIFTVEYGLRIWTAEYLHPDLNSFQAKMKFIISFYGIIDLLTFIPYFLPFFFPSGAVVFRMLRVVRIFHLFRINYRYDAFNVITDVLKDKRDQLISSIFMVVVLMMGSSLCMYGMEHEAQPENFKNAFSGIWWSVSTLLTVGYGDIYPITTGGRIIAIIIAFLGVGMVAIPTGIISAGFVEYYTRIKVGDYTRHDADFITIDIDEAHPYVGQKIGDIALIPGLYVAVLIRNKDVLIPYLEMNIKKGDILLLGTSSSNSITAKLEEVTLDPGHPWIDRQIKNLDISRQSFIIMIKRKKKVVKPEGGTTLRMGDEVIMLHKYSL